jgi:hypothetical protein
MPCLAREGAGVLSVGPDRADSLGAYRPFNVGCFSEMYKYSPTGEPYHPVNTEYDPTNGTLSAGDLMSFVGKARLLAHQ